MYKDVRFLDPPEPDMLRGYKRVDILTAACHLGYQDCVENSVRNFGTWMLEPNPDNINPYASFSIIIYFQNKFILFLSLQYIEYHQIYVKSFTVRP